MLGWILVRFWKLRTQREPCWNCLGPTACVQPAKYRGRPPRGHEYRSTALILWFRDRQPRVLWQRCPGHPNPWSSFSCSYPGNAPVKWHPALDIQGHEQYRSVWFVINRSSSASSEVSQICQYPCIQMPPQCFMYSFWILPPFSSIPILLPSCIVYWTFSITLPSWLCCKPAWPCNCKNRQSHIFRAEWIERAGFCLITIRPSQSASLCQWFLPVFIFTIQSKLSFSSLPLM